MKENWILTDDDCLQYIKKNSETVFELIEIRERGEKDGLLVVNDIVNINDYSEEEKEDILYLFGYENVDINDEYGEEGNQILAECIFESQFNHCLFTGSENECIKFIENYINNN